MMNKTVKIKLLKKLQGLCPSLPAVTTKKTHDELIEQLFILCPKSPYRIVSGIELVKKMDVPLNPKK